MSEQLINTTKEIQEVVDISEVVFEALDQGKQDKKYSLETNTQHQNRIVEAKVQKDVQQGIQEIYREQRTAEYTKALYLRDMDMRYYKEAIPQTSEQEAVPELRIYNKEGMKHLIKDAIIDAYLSGNKESLSKYARFAIDINGLKAVNDLAGHEAGDEFLLRAVHRLDEMKQLIQDRYNTARIEISHEGGDEFGVFIETNDAITAQQVQEIGQVISNQLQYKCSDLLTNDIIEKKGKMGETIPEGYEFHSSAGVGSALFKEVFINPGTLEELDIRKEEMRKCKGLSSMKDLTRDDVKNLLMGMILDETDDRMIEHKKEVKSTLLPFEQKLLLRNEELKQMHDQFALVDGEMERLKNDISLLTEQLATATATKERLETANNRLNVNLTECTVLVENLMKKIPSEGDGKVA